MTEIYIKTKMTELPKRCADCSYFKDGSLSNNYDSCVLLHSLFLKTSPYEIRLSSCPLIEITPSNWASDDEKR